MYLKGRDLLTLSDLTDAEMAELIAFARELKSRFLSGEPMEFLQGTHLFVHDPGGVLGSWDPFGLAISQLGGRAHRLAGESLRESWGETWMDRLQLLDETGHGLAMASLGESGGHPRLDEAASQLRQPLLNMMSDLAAPFQALASLMTLQERRGEEGSSSRAAMLWAPPGQSQRPPSLPFSLSEILLRSGVELRVACPSEFHPGLEFTELLAEAGGGEIVEDPAGAVEGADLVYALNWSLDSGDGLAEPARQSVDYSDWTLHEETLAQLAPEALVGGGLPRSRDLELEASLLAGPRSLHRQESANLLHVAKAFMALSLDPNLSTETEDHDGSALQ